MLGSWFMKKILGIIVLSLLLSGSVYAGWFDKDKITVKKCYDPTKANNYKAYKKQASQLDAKKWEWELNLKEKIAYRIIERDGQLKIDQFKIKISTKSYIIAHDPSGEGDFQFDLEDEAYITSIFGMNIRLLCNFS